MNKYNKYARISISVFFLFFMLLGVIQFLLLPMDKDTTELQELEETLEDAYMAEIPPELLLNNTEAEIESDSVVLPRYNGIEIPNVFDEYQIPIVVLPPFDSMNVTMVGDSVMLGAVPTLQELLPGSIIDAQTSRQVSDGVDILSNLEERGELGSTVVIALGLNSPFKEAVGQELIDYLGTERQIYWVDVYGKTVSWEDDSNKVIYALIAANDNVELISWNELAQGQDDWFYSDGIHLKPEGQEAYANLIYETVEY